MPLSDDLRTGLAEKLDALWKTSKPVMMERMQLLEDNCGKWLLSPHNAPASRAAQDAAHKLAGVLGTFGMPRGSQLASAIESIVDKPEAATESDRGKIPALLRELRASISSRD
jgi:HPt (histidine-containing phosphotransfer) domain-containing protein